LSTKKQKLPVLAACRLVAALIVVMVHYEIIFGHFVVYGALGTTALSWFFVLSGFILSYTYTELETRAQFKRFYTHRFIRIYPVYFLSVAFSSALVIIGYQVMGENYFAEVHRPFELMYDLPENKDGGFWLMAVIRHLTFTQSASSIETLNLVFDGPLWSLVLEVYFYLTFPIFLFLLKNINTRARIAIAFLLGYLLQFVLILVFLPDAEEYNVMNLNVTVYTNPLIRGIEFVFGMLLYKLFALNMAAEVQRRMKLWPSILAASVWIIVVVLSEMYVLYQFRVYFVALPFVCYLVYALATMNWFPEGRADRICVLCGGISYVLYCFHWPLMELIQLFDLLPQLPFPLHLLLLTAVLLIFSWLIYRFVETPARKFLYRRMT